MRVLRLIRPRAARRAALRSGTTSFSIVAAVARLGTAGLKHVGNRLFPRWNVGVNDASHRRPRGLLFVELVFLVLAHRGDGTRFGATRALPFASRRFPVSAGTAAPAATRAVGPHFVVRPTVLFAPLFHFGRFSFQRFARLVVVFERRRFDPFRRRCGPFRTRASSTPAAPATRTFPLLARFFLPLRESLNGTRLFVDQIIGELIALDRFRPTALGNWFGGPLLEFLFGTNLFINARSELVGDRFSRPLGATTRRFGCGRLRPFGTRAFRAGLLALGPPRTFAGRGRFFAGPLSSPLPITLIARATVSLGTIASTVVTAPLPAAAAAAGRTRFRPGFISRAGGTGLPLGRRAVGFPVPFFENVPVRVGRRFLFRVWFPHFPGLFLRHLSGDDWRIDVFLTGRLIEVEIEIGLGDDLVRGRFHHRLGRRRRRGRGRFRLGELQVAVELQIDPQQVGSQLPPGIIIVPGRFRRRRFAHKATV